MFCVWGKSFGPFSLFCVANGGMFEYVFEDTLQLQIDMGCSVGMMGTQPLRHMETDLWISCIENQDLQTVGVSRHFPRPQTCFNMVRVCHQELQIGVRAVQVCVCGTA